MRYIDDVVDGDAPLPPNYRSREDYVLHRIAFAQNPVNPKDPVDHLLLACYSAGENLGHSFQKESDDILRSMLFDARRVGRSLVFPYSELHEHFHLLDVEGVVKATMKASGEDSSRYQALAPLGLASRIHYNLRDYEEDLDAGLVNVSEEDINRLEMNLTDVNSLGVQTWFKEQANLGLSLLDQHKINMKKEKFHWWSRLAFPLFYENSARKYFERI